MPAPKRTANRKATKPRTKPKSAKPSGGNSQMLLAPSDLRTIVLESAEILAPADIETLIANEEEVHKRLGKAPALPLFHAQTELAIHCLRDHLEGRAPQIPYRTIALLGAAVLYFLDEYDIIPDFLPKVGRLDDAAIMATAFTLARAGLERYCAATGRELPHDAPLAPSAATKRRAKEAR
jgi:uncharacterized membrane protein YkvA (DUF1232 family)